MFTVKETLLNSADGVDFQKIHNIAQFLAYYIFYIIAPPLYLRKRFQIQQTILAVLHIKLLMEIYYIVFQRGSQSIEKNNGSRFTVVHKWIRDNYGPNLKSIIRKLEYLIKVSTPFQRHKQSGWANNLPAMKHNFKLVNRGIEYFDKSYQTLCLGTVLTEQRGLYFAYPVRSDKEWYWGHDVA